MQCPCRCNCAGSMFCAGGHMDCVSATSNGNTIILPFASRVYCVACRSRAKRQVQTQTHTRAHRRKTSNRETRAFACHEPLPALCRPAQHAAALIDMLGGCCDYSSVGWILECGECFWCTRTSPSHYKMWSQAKRNTSNTPWIQKNQRIQCWRIVVMTLLFCFVVFHSQEIAQTHWRPSTPFQLLPSEIQSHRHQRVSAAPAVAVTKQHHPRSQPPSMSEQPGHDNEIHDSQTQRNISSSFVRQYVVYVEKGVNVSLCVPDTDCVRQLLNRLLYLGIHMCL